LREDAGGVVCRPGIVGAGVDDHQGPADLVLTLARDSLVPLRVLEVTLCRGVGGITPQKLLEFADGLLVAAVPAVEGAEVVPVDRRVGWPLLPAGDADQERAERQREQRRSHCTCSIQERTCFRKGGGGTALFRSCWFVVPVMADDDAFCPGLAGGVIKMTGIEAIPSPRVVDRVCELSVVVRAVPVL